MPARGRRGRLAGLAEWFGPWQIVLMKNWCVRLVSIGVMTVGLSSAAPLSVAAKTKGTAGPAAVAGPQAEASVVHVKGIEIERPNGNFLGLEIVGSNFVLSFYDADRKKIAPDVVRGTLRWPVKYQPASERTVLNPGSDGTSLTSLTPVRPPHQFKVFMSLFVEGSETAVESYVVDFHT
jgi:hypothetical protein